MQGRERDYRDHRGHLREANLLWSFSKITKEREQYFKLYYTFKMYKLYLNCIHRILLSGGFGTEGLTMIPPGGDPDHWQESCTENKQTFGIQLCS